jgi:hypothetical protein
LEAVQGSFLFFFHVQKLGKFNQNSLAESVKITLEKQNFPNFSKKINRKMEKNSPEKNSMGSIVFFGNFCLIAEVAMIHMKI